MAKLLYCEAAAAGEARGRVSGAVHLLPSHTSARILPDTSAEPIMMTSLRVGASAASIIVMSSLVLMPVTAGSEKVEPLQVAYQL